MQIKRSNIWLLEMLWWIATIVVVILILLPIVTKIDNYPYLIPNIVFVLVTITYTRYMFLLRFTPIARYLPAKLVLIFTALPLIIYLTNGLTAFQWDWEDTGFLYMTDHLDTNAQTKIIRYLRNEYYFFGVSSMIVAISIAIRMIVSIWRVRNRDTV